MSKTRKIFADSVASSNSAVIGTGNDAILCKLSCIQLKYFNDPFISQLFKNKKVRRSPIINRGYWVRVKTFDSLILNFLNSKLTGNNDKKQIISLGAGLDTTFFRLNYYYNKIIKNNLSRYIEIDFIKTTLSKIKLITSDENKKLFQYSEDTQYQYYGGKKPKVYASTGDMISDKYCIISGTFIYILCGMNIYLSILGKIYNIIGDLCRFDDILTKLEKTYNIIDYSKPTLIVSECVLIYIPSTKSIEILKWSQNKFSNNNGCAFVIYEQILPNTPFGKQMIKNLRDRDLKLESINEYDSISKQQKRFYDIGYDISIAWDLNRIYTDYLDKNETRQIERIEMFDEYEEWHMFMKQYCISYSICFPKTITNKSIPKIKKPDIIKSNKFKPSTTIKSTSNNNNDMETKTNDNNNIISNETKMDTDTTTDNITNNDNNNNGNIDDTSDELRQNWCKLGILDTHFNPKPLILPFMNKKRLVK